MKTYLRNRFYLRGTSPLGLFNTVTGALFNRVLVKLINAANFTEGWCIRKGTDFPPRNRICR